MRSFVLTNSNGYSYDMNEPENFLHDPSGLGFTRTTKYTKTGNKYVPGKDGFSQTVIAGKIRFKTDSTSSAYDKYKEFARFLQFTPLTVTYDSSEEYMIDVIPQRLEKTEVEEIGLDCSVALYATSQFYKTLSAENEDTTTDTGKVYDYEYPYTYAENTPGTVLIQSDSVNESPCKIYIYGPLTNPVWTHYLNGETEATGAITGSIASGDRLVIDTTTTPYRLVEETASGTLVNDWYQNSDWSTERFIHLGYGANRITVGHDGTNIPAMAVEAKIQYETV